MFIVRIPAGDYVSPLSTKVVIGFFSVGKYFRPWGESPERWTREYHNAYAESNPLSRQGVFATKGHNFFEQSFPKLSQHV